jgi:uncharacterized protein YqjF (DUF2071 family)
MRLPELQGVIRRRLLINFRVDPAVMQKHLPPPFRPKLHNGFAVTGICLIRLEEVRPRYISSILGLTSENAAHRIAVEWDDAGVINTGVYINRRDTGSLLNQIAGGRLFSGEHHRAAFRVADDGQHVLIEMASTDGGIHVKVIGCATGELPESSIFRSLEEASAFFQAGSLGYSATRDGTRLDGLSLQTHSWTVAPFEVDHVESSYFDNDALFPKGSIDFDCALVMRNVAHVWQPAPDLRISPACCSR